LWRQREREREREEERERVIQTETYAEIYFLLQDVPAIFLLILIKSYLQ
jgi:hypothetical protein